MSTSDRRALRLAATRLREQAEWAADYFRSGGKWESEYSYMRREYNRDLRLAARLERIASVQLEQARIARAESSPDAIDSERNANREARTRK